MTEFTLLDLVSELLELNDDNLAERVIISGDVQWCLSELYDILTDEESKQSVTKTNADRIRSMDDEVLAGFLAYTWATSARAWQKEYGETLHWLQQSAEED